MTGFADIGQWRLRVFTSTTSFVKTLALMAAVPSAALAVHHNISEVALMDAAALAWILAIWRLNQLPHIVRVLSYLGMLFAVAIGTLITVGTLGLCYLIATPVMAVILVGMRSAIVTLGICAVSMMALGLTEYSHFPMGNSSSNSLAIVFTYTLNFTCVGAFIIHCCSTLLKGLSTSFDDVRMFARSLEERQAAMHALNSELRLTSAALGGLNEMVLIAKVVEGAGALQPVIFANAAFERRSGYRADEIIGQSMRILYGPDTDSKVVLNMAEAMARQERVSRELLLYSKSGEPCWVEMDLVPFASEGQDITHWVAIGRDVTERRGAVDAIYQLAFFDVLTGLPNRRLLMERLETMVAGVHAGAGIGAVLYIDLDNFKHVNDARGHATGDALLRHTAACLTRAVHQHDTVARLGGDEFVVLVEDLGGDVDTAAKAALAVAERVRAALTQSVDIDSQLYQASGSIGVALPTRLGHTVPDLLREADTAMYHAKRKGRNGVALFEATMFT